jgi:hypothetical protein
VSGGGPAPPSSRTLLLHLQAHAATACNCGYQPCCPGPAPRRCSSPCSLQQSLGLAQDPSSQSDCIRNGFILLGFLIFFRVLVYWVLRRKTARI